MNANTSESTRPSHLGKLKYTPHLNHAELGPSLDLLLEMVLGFGVGALVTGFMVLAIIATSFSATFGPVLGITPQASSPPDASPLFVVIFLGVGLIPGIACTFMGGIVLHYLRFWRYPTIFNYRAGILQRGGKEICRLSEISEIRLRRITDPNYPGKASVGLLVALRDGSVLRLDPPLPPFPHLRPITQKESFTDLGSLHDGRQMESARCAASDIASRIGVSVNEFIERGSLAPPKNIM